MHACVRARWYCTARLRIVQYQTFADGMGGDSVCVRVCMAAWVCIVQHV